MQSKWLGDLPAAVVFSALRCAPHVWACSGPLQSARLARARPAFLPPPTPQAANFKLVPVQYQLLVVNLFTILGGCCCCEPAPGTFMPAETPSWQSLAGCTLSWPPWCPFAASQALLTASPARCRRLLHELGARKRWLVPAPLPRPGSAVGDAGACGRQQRARRQLGWRCCPGRQRILRLLQLLSTHWKRHFEFISFPATLPGDALSAGEAALLPYRLRPACDTWSSRRARGSPASFRLSIVITVSQGSQALRMGASIE